jgi:hypothetical protein
MQQSCGYVTAEACKLARPERFELPTFWFVAKQSTSHKPLSQQDYSADRVLNIPAGKPLPSACISYSAPCDMQQVRRS